MTPRWLVGCLVATVSGVLVLSIGWWGACTFYIGPQLWAEYVRSDGRLPEAEPEVCRDVDSRSVASLMALLATLIGIAGNPPGRGP